MSPSTETFPYLLGRARLASGQPGRAALTLERAVAIDPAFAAARMELARAYYESGAPADAQREFLLLSAQNPPPAARHTISEYLERIEGRPALPPPSRTFYFAAAAGYDNNANVATEVNDFLGFALDDMSLAASSSYLEGGGGIHYHRQGTRRRAFDAVAGLSHRHYPDASFVDSTTATFRAIPALPEYAAPFRR